MPEQNPCRTYRFCIAVDVAPEQPGYDDPEWIADAAQGALANIYGYECTYGEIVELRDSEVTEP